MIQSRYARGESISLTSSGIGRRMLTGLGGNCVICRLGVGNLLVRRTKSCAYVGKSRKVSQPF